LLQGAVKLIDKWLVVIALPPYRLNWGKLAHHAPFPRKGKSRLNPTLDSRNGVFLDGVFKADEEWGIG
jgi:hypothetical protein